jgi:hypothetical protein
VDSPVLTIFANDQGFSLDVLVNTVFSMHMFASLAAPKSIPDLLSAPAYAVTGRHPKLRSVLRPSDGSDAVSRVIASPFERLPRAPRVIDLTDEAIEASAACQTIMLQSTAA